VSTKSSVHIIEFKYGQMAFQRMLTKQKEKNSSRASQISRAVSIVHGESSFMSRNAATNLNSSNLSVASSFRGTNIVLKSLDINSPFMSRKNQSKK
jgi:hypothetical protein